MKQLEFETSKGRFVIKELSFIPLDCNGIKLSEITEEQASEIVDYSILKNLYVSYSYGLSTDSYVYKTAIESLHSLLKSKGIHLFKNPIDFPEYIDGYPDAYLDDIQEGIHLAEQKTFYNPYIFKL